MPLCGQRVPELRVLMQAANQPGPLRVKRDALNAAGFGLEFGEHVGTAHSETGSLFNAADAIMKSLLFAPWQKKCWL